MEGILKSGETQQVLKAIRKGSFAFIASQVSSARKPMNVINSLAGKL